MATIKGGIFCYNRPMDQSGIYRIVVRRPGKPPKFYIGQAAILRVRKASHFRDLRRGRHPNKPLQNAFIKYGMDALSFEVLIICEARKEVLSFYEQATLDSYETAYVYNIRTQCVDSGLGTSLSPLTRAKISAALTGTKRTSEQLAAMSEQTKRRMADPKKRAAIAETTRLLMADPENRKRISLALKGKPASPGTVANLRRLAQNRIGTKRPREEVERRIAVFKANYKPRHGRKIGADEIARRQATRSANRSANGLNVY